jgi:type IV pilus assembly protein PilO
MAKKRPSESFDLALALRRFGQQFQGLNPNDPSVWPAVPRYALCVAVVAAVLAALWFVWLTNSNDELDAERAKEVTLRADYQKKVAQAANLDLLKKQREQVQQYVTLLEKQLPSKAEMDALLSDINQAGLGRSLQFELFRPGQISVKDYYAELPIAVRVTGRYHDMGAFAADIANLSRIVTLNNLSVAPQKDGVLVMDATARTYRYLDDEEQAAQKRAAAGAAGAKKK